MDGCMHGEMGGWIDVQMEGWSRLNELSCSWLLVLLMASRGRAQSPPLESPDGPRRCVNKVLN